MLSSHIVFMGILAALVIIFGVSVYLRDKDSILNRWFFAFTLSVGLWVLINYVAADITMPHAISLWANRLVLIVGGMTILSLLIFVLYMADWWEKTKFIRYLAGLNVIAWALCLTPYVVSDVAVADSQVVNTFGLVSPVYFVSLFLTAITAGMTFIVAHIKLKGRLRSQVDVIGKTVLIVVPIVVVGNAVLPLYGYYNLVIYTPISLMLLVFAMAYVIIKHRLFNMRPVLVRSMAYVFSLTVISTLYALFVHYLSMALDEFHNPVFSSFSNIILVIAIITAYPPLKHLFDKLTNGIFYKEAYDPQDLISEINKVHVGELRLDVLLNNSLAILNRYMKTQFVGIVLKDASKDTRSFISGQLLLKSFTLEQICSVAARKRLSLFVADWIEDVNDGDIQKLIDDNVSIIIKFGETSKARAGVTGYLVLGSRNSGVAYTTSDIKVLRTIVNEMTLAIQNALHFEEIKNFNVTLQERVEQATKELRKTNEKLKKLDETKDEFISMASHQLRTPLTSVKGYLSMVLEGDAGELNEQQRQLLGQSYSSSQRMVYLISDLLNLSRLNTGKFVIEATPLDLREIIAAEVEQLSETAKVHGVRIVYDPPGSFPLLMLDETKTHQVVMNFLDNAIYYTPTGGEVKVSLTQTATSVEYRVKDSGIGVPRAEQHRLFSKFYRAENARRIRPDGTGLGLFMSKKVIVAQGGSIIFESEEGKGSTFGFRFSKSGHIANGAKAEHP